MSNPIAPGWTSPPHRGGALRLGTVALLGCLLAAEALPAQATSLRHQTVVDLIQLSESILVGRVSAVTDGFENGVPYTEITLQVDETLKGPPGGVYTFRQIGLSAPRTLADGRTCVALSPDGWPRFESGEEVLLFLYQKGSQTGFRTTVGLFQGKFHRDGGRFVNAIDNQGLFQNVAVTPGLLSKSEEKLLTVKKGGVWAETFLSFVRKAVQGQWVENRKLRHVR